MNFKEIQEEIVAWIATYANSSNLGCLVVGVSGGVDSAVVSTLCAHTGKKVLLLKLPLSSTPTNTSLSNLHVAELTRKFNNVEEIEIDLIFCKLALNLEK